MALRKLLVVLESGSRPKGGVKGIESGVPSLGGEHLDGNGGFRLDRVRYVPREFAASMRRGRIAVGDVLVVKDGATTGKVSLVRDSFPYKDAVINEHVFLCRFDALVDPRYVFWYLFSAQGQRQILSDFRGAAQGGISQRFADVVQVPLRSIDEQRRIVAEIEKQFSRIDEAVANLKRTKANLIRYHARVLADAVYGWSTRPLGSLLREPLRNGHSAKATDDPNGLRAFTLTAVTEGDFTERNTKRTVAEPRKVADLWAQPGDIYIERSNTPELVGTARLYKGPPAFAFIPDLLIRMRVDESALLPEFAEIALRSEPARRYFRSRAQGIAGSMPKIDQGVVEAFEMPLPPLAEQRRVIAKVDRRLSIVREVEAEVDTNLKRALALRQAVLAKVFAA